MNLGIIYSYFILQTCLSISFGVRLYPCEGPGYQEVVENSPAIFYCDEYAGSVTWVYRSPLGLPTVTMGTCTSTGCSTTAMFPMFWTVRFISAGNSSLTTSHTSRQYGDLGGQFWCGNEACGLHVTVPAVVSAHVASDIVRHGSDYSMRVSAVITRVYSSRGLYSCVWQLGSSSLTTSPDLDPPANDTRITADRSGSCYVTMPLPSNPGTHACKVRVTPGNTLWSCGNVTIIRPSTPTISCPSDVISENTSLTCTCHTDEIGQPGGRLRWFTGTGSDISTEVVSGDYDVNSLTMTWTVKRHDNNIRKFRCVNNWMENITAHNDYTVRVASAVTKPGGSAVKGAAIGCGVGAAVVVVVAIVVIVVKRRRRQNESSLVAQEERVAQDPHPPLPPPGSAPLRSPAGNQRTPMHTYLQASDPGVVSAFQQSSHYINLAADVDQEGQPDSEYTCLRTSDMGLSSDYTQLTLYINATASPDQGSVHEDAGAGKNSDYANVPKKL